MVYVHKQLTGEQIDAVAAFETAAKSLDLHSTKFAKRWAANQLVARLYQEIIRLDAVDALTTAEKARAIRSQNFIAR